jgi:hypothetical protein
MNFSKKIGAFSKKMTEENRSYIYQILDHYWESRGLIVFGVLVCSLIPWPVLLLFVVADFFLSNPEIPTCPPTFPREGILCLIQKLQSYRTLNDQIKKTE